VVYLIQYIRNFVFEICTKLKKKRNAEEKRMKKRENKNIKKQKRIMCSISTKPKTGFKKEVDQYAAKIFFS